MKLQKLLNLWNILMSDFTTSETEREKKGVIG
jgi:hypothetical protein